MRGHGIKNIFAENMLAFGAQKQTADWIKRKLKMCWKCQKDKPVNKGANLRIMGRSVVKFICDDCAKLKENNV